MPGVKACTHSNPHEIATEGEGTRVVIITSSRSMWMSMRIKFLGGLSHKIETGFELMMLPGSIIKNGARGKEPGLMIGKGEDCNGVLSFALHDPAVHQAGGSKWLREEGEELAMMNVTGSTGYSTRSLSQYLFNFLLGRYFLLRLFVGFPVGMVIIAVTGAAVVVVDGSVVVGIVVVVDVDKEE